MCDTFIAVTTAPELGSSVNLVERSASLRSSTGSTSSDPTSPRSRRRRKFIKNIRPEAFKRPSYSMQGEGQIGKLMDQKDCSLVGYRKINHDSLPVIGTGNQSVLTNIELGTLSPASQGRSVSAFGTAVSLPTLQTGAEARISLSASLPDLCIEKDDMMAQEIKKIASGQHTGSSTSDLEFKNDSVFHEDPSVSTIQISEDVADNLTSSDTKVKKVVNPENCDRDSSTSDDGNNVQNGYFSSGNEQELTDSSPSAQNGTKDIHCDYLAETLTKALGEPEETDHISNTLNVETVTEIKNSNKESNVQNSNKESDVLTKTETNSNYPKKDDNESSQASESQSAQNMQETSVKSAANGNVNTVESAYMSQECTVLELLKEEYERSITSKEAEESNGKSQLPRRSGQRKSLVSPVSDATIK